MPLYNIKGKLSGGDYGNYEADNEREAVRKLIGIPDIEPNMELWEVTELPQKPELGVF